MQNLKNLFKLLVMIRIRGFDVLLATVKNWFGGEELGENAANCPDVDCLGIMSVLSGENFSN